MPASSQSNVNCLRAAHHHCDMSDVAVFAIAEKEQVPCPRTFDSSFHRYALSCLLPCVAQKMNAMQRENALKHSGAVGAPRRDAAPLIVRSLKQRRGRRDNCIGRRRKCFATPRQIHCSPGDDMTFANYGAEWEVEHGTFCIANAAPHRELTWGVPSPRHSLVVAARLGVARVQPAFITIGSPHSEPSAFSPDYLGTMAVKQLGLLGSVCARLAEYRREGSLSGDLSQCSGQSMRGISYTGVGDGSGNFEPPEHFRQRTTPRKLQMTQIKVPHAEHG